MTTARTWLARAVIVVLTAGVCAWVWSLRGEAPPPFEPPAFESLVIDGVTVPRERLEAAYPHVVDSDMFHFDPVAIVRPFPNQTRVQPWKEHPAGELLLQTNDLGLRDDEPTGAPRGRRVLVVGDSHTYGLVNVDECLHARLEERLARHFGEPFEVLNAAIGGIGPYEYAGAVDLFVPRLEPEAVVVVCFTGNDFANALTVADLVADRRPAGPPPDAARRMADVREHWSRKRCMAQGLNQTFQFVHRPEAEALAVDATIRCFERIAGRCDDAGAALVVATLPTKMAVEPHDERELLDAVLAALDLTREDDTLHRRMGRALTDALDARGVATVDPFDAMVAAEETLYWRGDHHLNHRGIDVLADALMPALVAALEGR